MENLDFFMNAVRPTFLLSTTTKGTLKERITFGPGGTFSKLRNSEL